MAKMKWDALNRKKRLENSSGENEGAPVFEELSGVLCKEDQERMDALFEKFELKRKEV